MEYKCKICGNAENNAPYVVKEMMFGLRHEFVYVKCPACGCLQLMDIPEDMTVYYPAAYYSFGNSAAQPGRKSFKARFSYSLMRCALRHQVGKTNLSGWLARKYKPEYYRDYYAWLHKGLARFDSRILDVGCGGGELLDTLGDCGFHDLTGVDPYIASDILLKSGGKIYKKEIFDLEGTYDLIMLHHSFEHMAEPSRVLAKLGSLLAENGTLLIRIPVADCYAWRKYGVDWFEIDAPRHFFLHTVKSLGYLAEKNRLAVKKIVYDSEFHQIAISEKYLRGYTFTEEAALFTEKEITEFKSFSARLNAIADGDRACFYLKHSIA